ncbi:serine/threonine-protein kinase [Piscinibacter sakaiensis]|uniref:Protein kinase domain-containing protein n=1 Tax=Piscinibacter sakaiensis TaxID=1547922 RepID=A0A0K8NYR4_PISS1|nr:serine/threonine-protein kinase [Piscinibacter sakaiensis]GAP35060.1 hypothetical protein ISF6_0625 [Piscinibacter sakaiensis]
MPAPFETTLPGLPDEGAGAPDAAGDGAASSAASDRVGERFGPWEAVRRLGAGGMGEVYAARRVDGQYEGRAAVKLIKRGMDSAAVLERFAQERQALARLNHPNIARLIDAGLSRDGRPYFVMEQVEGRPIDEAARDLPLEGRLALFLQLADAVAYAHRQLLVHRDLKPGNVLVTAATGPGRVGQVKLLDFGIAKALDPAPSGGDTTLGAERPFTPNFASPEQVRGEPVDTATDIYSLGAVLYSLLTGVRPTGRRATTPEAAARSVLEEMPTRPSALGPDEAADPQWLRTRRRLKGDLDRILLKALEKPPERRYRSVDALAQDVRAYLAGHPVSARAPRAGYLFAKFVQRHRLAVAASVLGVGGLAVGLAASLWQAQAAERARDEARAQAAELKRLTTDLVFRFGDALTRLPGGMAAQEATLKQTLAALDTALRAAPDDVDVQALVASALARLAEIQGSDRQAAPQRAAEARATVDRALALGERVWQAGHADWRFASWHVRTLTVQAQLLRAEGRPADALGPLNRAIERSTAMLQRQPPLDGEGRAHMVAERAAAQMFVARMQLALLHPELALNHYALAEADHRALLGDEALLHSLEQDAAPGDVSARDAFTHQLAATYAGQARAHERLDDLPAMRQAIDQALALRRQVLAREPDNLAWRDGLMTDSLTLALARLRLGEAEPALEAAQTSWDTARRLAEQQGPESKWAGILPTLAPVYGRALAAVGRHDEALAAYELALTRGAADLARRDDPALRLQIAQLQVWRARSMAARGDAAAAAPLLATALAALRGLAAPAAPQADRLHRDAVLALAEAAALQAELVPAEAAVLRGEAAAALKDAAARQRLGADHERLLASLAPPG